jgi:hypothetical protein
MPTDQTEYQSDDCPAANEEDDPYPAPALGEPESDEDEER